MKEKRIYEIPESLEKRAFEDEKGNKHIIGYASIYNHRSKLLFENDKFFYEYIKPGAFDDVLRNDTLNVVATYNHHREQILGRNVSGTLQLSTDEIGLKYDITLPNTTLGRDIYELVQRGDLFESSFVFNVSPDNEKSYYEDGVLIREINKVDGLWDVSVVVDGAYSNTDVMARNYDELVKEIREKDEKEIEKEKRDVDNLSINKDTLKYKMRATILKLKK